MKTTLLSILCLLVAAAAWSAPELSGVFVVGDRALFQLEDSDSGKGSGWLALGDAFEGYALRGYDFDRETLTLVRNGAAFEIGLRAAAVETARMTLAGTLRLGAADVLEVRKATLFLGEESSFPLAPGVAFFVTPTKRPDGNMQYDARWEMTDGDGNVDTIMAPTAVARPGQAFAMRVGELGFELAP